MNRLTEMFEKERADKFKMTGLQYERVKTPREVLPESLDDGPAIPGIHGQNRIAYLKDKYGIKGDALECEGLLGARLREESQTLEDRLIDNARASMQGKRLKICSANYQSKPPVRIYLEITKS